MIRILVIEHEERIGMVVRGSLGRAGCTVEVVADADAALEQVRTGGYDLILLDIGLPDVLRVLREADVTVPVLVVARQEMVCDALRRGYLDSA